LLHLLACLNWLAKRTTRQLRLGPDQHWLDLRVPETRAVLRTIFAPALLHLGLPDLDVSAVYGPSRTLTQAIGRWAYEARRSEPPASVRCTPPGRTGSTSLPATPGSCEGCCSRSFSGFVCV
jgi:hypothetical protein